MSDTIAYRRGYKYQLAEDYVIETPIEGWDVEVDGFLDLDVDGTLYIAAGYAWDGPSGPTIDTKSFMRASLVHDALYQLMRTGELPRRFRLLADELLFAMCREDGMSWLRAQWVYRSVRLFGEKATRASSARELEKAP